MMIVRRRHDRPERLRKHKVPVNEKSPRQSKTTLAPTPRVSSLSSSLSLSSSSSSSKRRRRFESESECDRCFSAHVFRATRFCNHHPLLCIYYCVFPLLRNTYNIGRACVFLSAIFVTKQQKCSFFSTAPALDVEYAIFLRKLYVLVVVVVYYSTKKKTKKKTQQIKHTTPKRKPLDKKHLKRSVLPVCSFCVRSTKNSKNPHSSSSSSSVCTHLDRSHVKDHQRLYYSSTL